VGRHTATVLIAIVGLTQLAVAGCGGDGASTSVAPDDSTTTRTAPASAPAGPPSQRSGKPGGRPPAGSPKECLDEWDEIGPASSLEHVLLPAVRAVGPFRTEVTVFDPRTAGKGRLDRIPQGSCVIVVFASGIEGGGKVSYIAVRGAGDAGFVQALEARHPRDVIGAGTNVLDATLRRDGSLSLRP
jgi:hypothetical protein